MTNSEFFSGTERYHSSKQYVLEHTGKLKDRMFSGCMCAQKQEYYDCCGENKGKEGCEEMWACCKKPIKNEGCGWRYKCCQMDMGMFKTIYKQNSVIHQPSINKKSGCNLALRFSPN